MAVAVMGVLACGTVGACAAQRQAAPTTGAAAAQSDREVDRFRRWLARENGWTQKQRLDRIEREWMPRLQTLPAAERAEVAAAIEDAISSPRLDRERIRVMDRVLTSDTQMARR